jgi:hypothetical protein
VGLALSQARPARKVLDATGEAEARCGGAAHDLQGAIP